MFFGRFVLKTWIVISNIQHLTGSHSSAKFLCFHQTPGSLKDWTCWKLHRCRAKSKPSQSVSDQRHDKVKHYFQILSRNHSESMMLVNFLIGHIIFWFPNESHTSYGRFCIPDIHNTHLGHGHLLLQRRNMRSPGFQMYQVLRMKKHCACSPAVMPNPGFTNSSSRQQSVTAKGNRGASKAKTKRTIRVSSAG